MWLEALYQQNFFAPPVSLGRLLTQFDRTQVLPTHLVPSLLGNIIYSHHSSYLLRAYVCPVSDIIYFVTTF